MNTQARRYVVNNRRSAVLAVLDELGPNAVILSYKKSQAGIEVVATVNAEQSFDKTSATTLKLHLRIPGAPVTMNSPVALPCREQEFLGLKTELVHITKTTNTPSLRLGTIPANHAAGKISRVRLAVLEKQQCLHSTARHLLPRNSPTNSGMD
ncbi:MAG TPA: hypothetical protein VIM41_06360 [Gammaproteobacteria bacterium]